MRYTSERRSACCYEKCGQGRTLLTWAGLVSHGDVEETLYKEGIPVCQDSRRNNMNFGISEVSTACCRSRHTDENGFLVRIKELTVRSGEGIRRP